VLRLCRRCFVSRTSRKSTVGCSVECRSSCWSSNNPRTDPSGVRADPETCEALPAHDAVSMR
jgi:hypothetical protein